MKKTEDRETLLKACGRKVYHVTSEKHLNSILTNGLTNFWFGMDLEDCFNMVEYSHKNFDREHQIAIVIPVALLDADKCDFTCDSGDGWSDEWFGTGFYSGTIDTKDCRIYDLN